MHDYAACINLLKGSLRGESQQAPLAAFLPLSASASLLGLLPPFSPEGRLSRRRLQRETHACDAHLNIVGGMGAEVSHSVGRDCCLQTTPAHLGIHFFKGLCRPSMGLPHCRLAPWHAYHMMLQLLCRR
jgi:hypothetical protein